MGRLNSNTESRASRRPAIGETKVWTGSEDGLTYTLTRTNRDYAYDLADAYNAGMPRKDIEWFVNEGGTLQLRDRADFTENHTKFLKWKDEEEQRKWLHFHRNPYRADDHHTTAGRG